MITWFLSKCLGRPRARGLGGKRGARSGACGRVTAGASTPPCASPLGNPPPAPLPPPAHRCCCTASTPVWQRRPVPAGLHCLLRQRPRASRQGGTSQRSGHAVSGRPPATRALRRQQPAPGAPFCWARQPLPSSLYNQAAAVSFIQGCVYAESRRGHVHAQAHAQVHAPACMLRANGAARKATCTQEARGACQCCACPSRLFACGAWHKHCRNTQVLNASWFKPKLFSNPLWSKLVQNLRMEPSARPASSSGVLSLCVHCARCACV